MTPLKKSTLREIRQSFGRFLAIFAIVALGVGFFSGLRVTRSAMLETGDNYITEHNLYDFRLISTLGFTPEDAARLTEEGCVQIAEGAISCDALLHDSGEEKDSAVRIHSVTNEVNTLSLVSGRMPEKAGECVADARAFSEDDIGTVLTVSDGDDAKDMLSVSELTVVGTVNSCIYLNFERGSTSVGEGKLSYFVFVTEESFSVDYYTEIYLSLTDSAFIYSDEYDSITDGAKDGITSLCESLAAERYEGLRAEAYSQIDEGQAKYEENLAEYELRKSETYGELSDAEAQLSAAAEKLSSAREEIASKEAELDRGEAELASAREQYNFATAEYSEKKAEYDEGEAQYGEGFSLYCEGLSRYESGLAQYNSSFERLTQLRRLAQLGNGDIRIISVALWNGIEKLYSGLADVGFTGLVPIDELHDRFMNAVPSLTAMLSESEKALSSAKAELDSAAAQLAETEAQLSSARKELDSGKAALDAAAEEISAAGAKISAGQAEADAGRAAIAEGKATLESSAAEYEASLKKYESGKADAERGFAEAEAQLADAKNELDDARSTADSIKSPVCYVLGREANTGYACFENDSSIVDGISKVFPVFFFLVAALVCVTTMSRMIEEQRTQIGTLKALGFGSGAIAAKYIFYSGFAALTGAFAGYFIGCVTIPWIIWQVYNIMYGFAPLITVFDIKLLALSLAVAMLCSVGTAYVACRRSLRENAAELIRPKSPKNGKRVLLERLPFIWKRLKFLPKVSIRNVMRYKNRMVMMILGVGGCTALLLTGFGINDSISNIAVFQFDEIMRYDYSVSFTEEMNDGAQADFCEKYGADTDGILFLHSGSCEAVGENKMTKTVNVIASDSGVDGFVDLHRGTAHVSFPDDGEAVISEKLADTLGLKTGDSITLRDSDMNEITLTLSGICDNYVNDFVYVTRASCARLDGYSPTVRTAYVNVPEGSDPHASAAIIAADSLVGNVSVNADTRVYVEKMMSSLDYIILLVSVCAAALAFIVIYNLTNINITERVREIATLKVLGFYRREAGAYVFRENIALSVIGAAAGLIMGVFLHRYVMSCINIDMVAFDVRVSAVSYAASFALTILFAAAVDMLMYLKIGMIDMAQSLKSADG